MTYAVVDSPLGPLRLSGDGRALARIDWGADGAGERDDTAFPAARAQLAEYFAGRRTAFELELAPAGTPFQLRVWEELLAVPFGETISYAELAERIGRPGSYRAVGHANAHNPLPVVVPCHRVIGSDGTLTGYGGGLECKALLLELEARPRHVSAS